MSQRDIAEQIKELYGVEISPELVTKISEKIMPEVTAWQNRPLEPVYPFVFMDAIHYKVREDRRYVTKAAVRRPSPPHGSPVAGPLPADAPSEGRWSPAPG